ncbi:MAG: transcription elongation factor GreA [Oscillospiraceae bacterium]|nr:transcription elongation factor GreA [Oscillospiraceae bacterium]
MPENTEIVLTSEGKKELEEELEYLKTVVRKQVSEKIKHARGFGDLSENAEYDEAKNEQAEVEERISKIEYKLKYARVIEESEIKSDIVTPGVRVKIYDVEFDEELEYQIVGPAEADPAKNKLSYESPVGAGILNRKKGDSVKIQTPGGESEFRIVDIMR